MIQLNPRGGPDKAGIVAAVKGSTYYFGGVESCGVGPGRVDSVLLHQGWRINAIAIVSGEWGGATEALVGSVAETCQTTGVALGRNPPHQQ